VIQNLSASPSTMQAGQSSSIQWSVSGASSLTLSGVGAVNGTVAKVAPLGTTTYTLTATNASGSVSQNVTVLVGPQQQQQQMGVVTHFGQNKGNVQANLTLIQQTGATSIRDEVHWSSVEHQLGVYAVPASADTFVNASLAKGLKPLLTLDYGNPLYDGGDKPVSAAAVEGYARYAEFVVSHFKGRVSLYEIWNEWNGGVGGTTPGTADTYVRLLKVVYPRLKAIDPNVVIIGGVVSGGGITDGWFKQMLDGGALNAADAISIHQYIFTKPGYSRSPERLVNNLIAVENTLRSYNGGQDFPLYLSETGWPTITGGTPLVEAGDFNAETILLAATMPYLKGLWWYDFQDDGTDPTNIEHNFGLVKADLAPKPGYSDIASVMRWTSGAHFVKRLTTSDLTVDGVEFQLPDGQQAMALWRQGAGSSQVQTKGVSAVQLLQSGVASPASDSLLLQLTEAPVWITGQTLGLQ
jgi:polysaccharide biosynthesis protein PslG